MKAYDLILKESFQSLFLQSSKKWLGLDLSHAQISEVDLTINRPTHREVDFLRHVVMPDGQAFLLHLEFQTEDHKQMHLRMAEYRAMLQLAHQLPVRQYVIYLGQTPTKMPNKLPEAYQILGYDLISFNQLQAQDFLKSDSPDEIVFAILSRDTEQPSKQIVSRILERLHSLNLSSDELKKYLNYLLTLGQLRKLEHQVKQQVHAMPITIDITQNEIYKEALAEGLAKGLEKGLDEGKKQAVEGLLKSTNLSPEDIAHALSVSLEWVLEIKSEFKL